MYDRQGQQGQLGGPGTAGKVWRAVRQPCRSSEIRNVRKRHPTRGRDGARHLGIEDDAGEVAMSYVISFFKLEMLDLWNVLTAYRPERYYMRGPGPKWREKHSIQAAPQPNIITSK